VAGAAQALERRLRGAGVEDEERLQQVSDGRVVAGQGRQRIRDCLLVGRRGDIPELEVIALQGQRHQRGRVGEARVEEGELGDIDGDTVEFAGDGAGFENRVGRFQRILAGLRQDRHVAAVQRRGAGDVEPVGVAGGVDLDFQHAATAEIGAGHRQRADGVARRQRAAAERDRAGGAGAAEGAAGTDRGRRVGDRAVDLQRALADRRGTGVGVGAGQDQRAGAGLGERPGAIHVAAVGALAGLVEGHGGIVGDVTLQGIGIAAQGAGVDRRGTGIGVGAGQDQRAGAGLGDAVAAATLADVAAMRGLDTGVGIEREVVLQVDAVTDGDAAGVAQGGARAVDGEPAAAEGAVVGQPQGAAGQRGATAVGAVAGQRGGPRLVFDRRAAGDGHRRAGGGAVVGEVIVTAGVVEHEGGRAVAAIDCRAVDHAGTAAVADVERAGAGNRGELQGPIAAHGGGVVFDGQRAGAACGYFNLVGGLHERAGAVDGDRARAPVPCTDSHGDEVIGHAAAGHGQCAGA